MHCEHRAVRHTCYIFESQSQLCDAASASRHNHFDGTVYFAKSGLPKACQSQQRKHLMRLCRSAEKLPGIAMSHWPWQVSRPLLRCVLLPARDPPFCPLLHTLHPQAGWARKRRWPMVDCCVCVVRLSITLGRMSDVLLALMQGHSFNLNKRGFSGDSFLGPYGFSGRTGTRTSKEPMPPPAPPPARAHLHICALLDPAPVPERSKIGAWQ